MRHAECQRKQSETTAALLRRDRLMEVDDNKLHSEWKRTQKQTACRLPTPKNKIIDVFNIRSITKTKTKTKKHLSR